MGGAHDLCAAHLVEHAGDYSRALWLRANAGDAEAAAATLAAAAAAGAAADPNWTSGAAGGGATAAGAAAARGDCAVLAVLLSADGLDVNKPSPLQAVMPPLTKERCKKGMRVWDTEHSCVCTVTWDAPNSHDYLGVEPEPFGRKKFHVFKELLEVRRPARRPPPPPLLSPSSSPPVVVGRARWRRCTRRRPEGTPTPWRRC